MKIKAKLLSRLPVVKGTSTKGDWKKADAIFETLEQYPRKVCISFWNDQIKELDPSKVGKQAEIDINIESREYNGKWYTELKAYKIAFDSAEPSKAANVEPDNLNNPDIDQELPF